MTIIDETPLSTEQWKAVATPAGEVFLQTRCAPPFVAQLSADSGLRAFTRLPEREHHHLLGLAKRDDTLLTLAYTDDGKIIGQVSLTPIDRWWQGLGRAYEIAIEVSTNWRRLGLAHQLMSLVFEKTPLDDMIVLGMGLYWHWDMEGTGLSPFGYRAMLERFCAAYGFMEYLTSEPNIRMHPANILLARLGSDMRQEDVVQFFQCLLRSETLPGM